LLINIWAEGTKIQIDSDFILAVISLIKM